MDEVDIELSKALREIQTNPKARQKQQRTATQTTYTRPVRSWCLVLRANDSRIDTYCDTEVVGNVDWGPDQALCALKDVVLTAESVRALCAPVHIPWPGVSIDRASRLFGVNRTTVHRWGRGKHVKKRSQAQESPGFRESLGFVRSEGRVVIDSLCKGNGRDLHRATKRVWTRQPVDPAGEVLSGPWGSAITDLTHRVEEGWMQNVRLTHRPLGRRMVYVGLLQCPQCERWGYKLFWPQRIWTVAYAVGAAREQQTQDSGGFMCRRCAKVIYESAERGSRPGPGRRVNVDGRFQRRALGVMI